MLIFLLLDVVFCCSAREQEQYRAKLQAKIAREKRAAEDARRRKQREDEEEARRKMALAEQQREKHLRNVEVGIQ